MRKFAVMLFCVVSMATMYAGDVASFMNLGFSADGTRFVFGQYGITDSEYRAYADIYCVDVAKNSFVVNGKFSTLPSDVTTSKDARGVFSALQNSAASFIKNLGVDSANQGRSLYIHAEDEPLLKTISFRDFETGTTYSVTVHTLIENKNQDIKSSFYLTVVMTDSDGKTTTKTVGLPGFKRPGVKDYLVRRIILDPTGKSLVFIIEKEQYEAKGSSIRFMVETLRI